MQIHCSFDSVFNGESCIRMEREEREEKRESFTNLTQGYLSLFIHQSGYFPYFHIFLMKWLFFIFPLLKWSNPHIFYKIFAKIKTKKTIFMNESFFWLCEGKVRVVGNFRKKFSRALRVVQKMMGNYLLFILLFFYCCTKQHMNYDI